MIFLSNFDPSLQYKRSVSELGVRMRHSLALAEYGVGLPWYRLAWLRESFGVPFLLTPPCQKRKISANSLKSNPRKL
jgi:hypothetical protein